MTWRMARRDQEDSMLTFKLTPLPPEQPNDAELAARFAAWFLGRDPAPRMVTTVPPFPMQAAPGVAEQPESGSEDGDADL